LRAISRDPDARGAKGSCWGQSRGLLARHSGRHGRRGQLLVSETLSVDAKVLAHPLDIVARLVEGNALDQVDEIDCSVKMLQSAVDR
jgi:hypothetical protein